MMFRLKDVLPGMLKSLGISKQYNAQSVITHWQDIAGSEISRHSWPVSVERGVVLLAVNNSAWSHHLMIMKSGIIDKINGFLQEKLIYDIRFKAGDLKKYQNQEEDGQDIAVLQPSKLDADELSAVWKKTEAIQDVNLRKKCYYILIKETGIIKTRKSEGWQSCKWCSVLVSPGQTYCTACHRQSKEKKDYVLTKLLTEAPWLTYQESCRIVPCTAREFHTTKKKLVHKMIRGLFAPGWDKLNEAVLVMLMTGIAPDKINQATIDSVIGKIKVRLAEKVRRKKYVSAPGR